MRLTDIDKKNLKKFADMMIERMNQVKAGDWRQGWIPGIGGTPVNVEGREYRGVNVLFLLMAAGVRGYRYPVYLTLRQANKLGAKVRKGEKSVPVIFWDKLYLDADGNRISGEEYASKTASGKSECRRLWYFKVYPVFNIQQTDIEDAAPEKIEPLTTKFRPVDKADVNGMYANDAIDRLVSEDAWLCPIKCNELSDRAFYSPFKDEITLPAKAQFNKHGDATEIYADGQEYYSTLLHEMAHSTGTESRLDRIKTCKFGSDDYAKEELIAEMTAARVSAELGFTSRVIDNSAAYLDGWINCLKQEPEFILTLLTEVERAAEVITDRLAI